MLEQMKKTNTITLLGNEAIAYGLADGGVRFASAYPGTPSTEIMETLIKKFKTRMNADWASNEAVAMEEAAAAAIAGTDSAVMMKSVGLNVAMDPLMTLALMGVTSAMVIVVGDDPGMHSSQNEQDNRNISKFSGIPMFEPSSIQECYDFAREAVQFSRKFKIPVFLRSVTRISHEMGQLELSPPVVNDIEPYERDPSRFVSIPGNARKNKSRMMKIQREIDEYVQEKKYYREYKIGKGNEYLVITSGSSSTFAHDALSYFGFNAHVLVPGLINPFPSNRFVELCSDYENVIVIEELDPFIEEKITILAYKNKLNINIIGKDQGITSIEGEITGEILMENLARYFNLEHEIPKTLTADQKALLKIRPPVLCPGCPHRSSYVAIKKALRKDQPIYSNDIGCYALGFLPPHNTADTLVAMGASIPMATAIAISRPEHTSVAMIGDSTFWHSGVSGITNAVWKGANLLVIVLDNLATAMTGDQPNPSANKDPEDSLVDLSIEETCKGMGAWVRVINPMEYKDTQRLIDEAKAIKGVKVLILREPCALNVVKEAKIKKVKLPLIAINDNCNGCKLCITPLGCPALSLNEDNIAEVDPELCNGCTFCQKLCNRDAIEVVSR